MSGSHRLVRNTFYMYLRMGILMLISLYTSRVVLKYLGVDDFGIYNVVGSIVALFTSLRLVFASSTQRFMSYEMGQNHADELIKIFNMSLMLNAIIALIFVLLVEPVGIWFINNKMTLGTSRVFAARCVFHFSVISAVVGIFTTSFDACILANERMDFYAIMSIIEGGLKLGAVFMLQAFTGDRLILYGFLLLVVAAVVLLSNFVFCRFNFLECRIRYLWDKSLFKKMASFSGWNFFGNTASALSQNGMNMVLNVFGGPVVNAARGISYQVSNALQQFTSNIAVAIKPYAIKTYAMGDVNKSMYILEISSKIYFSVQYVIVAFFVVFSSEIIQIWLGQVPEYSIAFLKLVLIHSLIRSLHNPLDILFYSVGKMKVYQISEGLILSLPVIISYFLLKFGYSFNSTFISVIVIEIVNLIVISLIASKQCGLDLLRYIKTVLCPCAICCLFFASSCIVDMCFRESLLEKSCVLILAITLASLFMFFVGFKKNDRQLILSLICKK